MNILPIILAEITGVPRQQMVSGVDFEWSTKSWTHNFFRAYELVFWRRFGIRREMSGSIENGILVEKGWTVEAKLAIVEKKIRAFFKKLATVRVVVYQPQFAGIPTLFPYLFAIAFDQGTNLGTGSSGTVTVTGSNPELLVTVHGNVTGASNEVTGTMNSVALHLLDSEATAADRTCYDFYITGADGTITGGQTLAITNSVSPNFVRCLFVSYSGANQAAPNDHQVATGVASNITLNINSATTADWIIGFTYAIAGTYSSGTGAITTTRGTTLDGGNTVDSNGGATTVGANAAGYNNSLSSTLNWMVVDITTPAVVAATYRPRRTLLGMGM